MLFLRALLTGLASGLLVFVAGAVAHVLRLGEALALALVCLPLALLAGASLFGLTRDRWPSRLVSGLLGTLLSAAAALSAVLTLRRHRDWFDYGGDQGVEFFYLLLACFAMIPGGAAAAAPRPGHGFGLALGFLLGTTIWMSWLAPMNPGLVILMAIGALVGTTTCAVRVGVTSTH